MRKNIKTKSMLVFYGYSILDQSLIEEIDDFSDIKPQYDQYSTYYYVKDTSEKTLIETLSKHIKEEKENLVIIGITKNHIIYDLAEDWDSELILCENYAFLSQ
jgi:hypothetical protein